MSLDDWETFPESPVKRETLETKEKPLSFLTCETFPESPVKLETLDTLEKVSVIRNALETLEKPKRVSVAFKQLGTHSESPREENDFYSTDPQAVRDLVRMLSENNIPIPKDIVETSVGQGHIAREFEKLGCRITAYDIVDRGYPGTIVTDYLKVTQLPEGCMIVENTPFKLTVEFLKHSLSLMEPGQYICSLQKIQFLEGQSRKKFFQENPPEFVFVFSKRTITYRNGDMEKYKSSALCYCWFIFRKGYKGDPRIKWI